MPEICAPPSMYIYPFFILIAVFVIGILVGGALIVQVYKAYYGD